MKKTTLLRLKIVIGLITAIGSVTVNAVAAAPAYNAYDHESFASCSGDNRYVYCPIRTGSHGRRPNRLVSLIVYPLTTPAMIAFCARRLSRAQPSGTTCIQKNVTEPGLMEFSRQEILSLTTTISPWWDHALMIRLDNADGTDAINRLTGYRVFWNLPKRYR